MQVELKAINSVTTEVNIQVPSSEVEQSWEKHLRKTARNAEVPGFRKGKAPLSMVERAYADRIKEYFLQDSVNEYFETAAKEHNLEYLLFPDVKDVQWEKGQDMMIKIELEHEPVVSFKQLDGLKVPYHPVSLDEEVSRYLEELRNQNARVVDVEEAIENDHIDVEYTLSLNAEELQLNASLFAGDNPETRAIPELIGKKTGDILDTELKGKMIKLTSRNSSVTLDNDTLYPVKVMVNSISRMQYPELDDDFAKDMEFESMEAMKTKIADDMRLVNEHKNLNVENFSIIGKLFIDNRFDLPKKTIDYLADKEAENSPHPEYRQYLKYQYQMQISQDLINMYILRNLRQNMPQEISAEMMEEYFKHSAILEDITVEAYKEKHKDEISEEDFSQNVQNYFILRKLAETADFYIPEPEEQKDEIEDAQLVEEELGSEEEL
ncbi:MAG: trigger factor [Candidatus Cloacimonetes bacterium]|nr:trigger factor [Candidatus Cloacimonadota bacterium]MDD2683051.1 trigger factor [Candidatus Cloacimonadota bacterium]MDD3096518.1 trigger factor [Candidatus Cloacimonadota bacterium]